MKKVFVLTTALTIAFSTGFVANTGSAKSFSTVGSVSQVNSTHVITKKEAKKIALKEIKGGKVTKTNLEKDNGKKVYEVKVKSKKKYYEVEIDAEKGKVLNVEKER